MNQANGIKIRGAQLSTSINPYLITGQMPRSLYFFLILLCLSNAVQAYEYEGRVVRVVDGDTVTVLDARNNEHKVRLAGIDAPEKNQAWGRASKDHLAKVIFQRIVHVETAKDDRYGREIGKIRAGGVDVNLIQIESGHAWHYKKYVREQPLADRASYSQAEEQARNRRVGLWSDATPIPPWEFRHNSR